MTEFGVDVPPSLDSVPFVLAPFIYLALCLGSRIFPSLQWYPERVLYIFLVILWAQLNDLTVCAFFCFSVYVYLHTVPVKERSIYQSTNFMIVSFSDTLTKFGVVEIQGLIDWLIDQPLIGSVQVQVHINRIRREGTYKSFSWAQKITRRIVDLFKVSLKDYLTLHVIFCA